jgi:O-antigen/teichoic acid export membrane protein
MTAVMQDSPSAKSVFYDGMYTLIGRVMRMVLALVLSVIVARALGPHDRGLYALPTAVYTGLVLSIFSGISQAVSYFMLCGKAGRGVLWPALWTGVIFSAIGAVPVAALALLGHNSWALIPSLLLLPATVPGMIVFGYALGTKQIRWNTTYQLLSTSALLLGMGVALLLFSRTAAVAVTTFVSVNLLVALVCLIIVWRDARRLPHRSVSLKDFMLFALRVGLVNLVSLLNYRADLYVVALLATPALLGLYAVGISAAESLLVLTQVPGIVTSPHVGAMELDDAARLTAKCVRATFVVALAICVLCSAIAPYAVKLLYGSAYLPLIPALRILLVAVIILSLGTPISNYFTIRLGKPEIALISNSCAAVLCVVASWFLVQTIGIAGAALATGLAYLLGQGIGIAVFVRSTGISLSTLLVPTRQDVQTYSSLVKTFLRDAIRRITFRSEVA